LAVAGRARNATKAAAASDENKFFFEVPFFMIALPPCDSSDRWIHQDQCSNRLPISVDIWRHLQQATLPTVRRHQWREAFTVDEVLIKGAHMGDASVAMTFDVTEVSALRPSSLPSEDAFLGSLSPGLIG